MSFGEKLRQARKRRGLTQKALADAVGARHNSVSNWESGRNRPDPDTIQSLCKTLQVDPNYFFEAGPELSGVEFALFGEVRELTEEDKQDVLDFIRFKKALRQQRRGQ